MMASPVFDVCEIGSGPGGGIANYLLTSGDLKVALVESGRADATTIQTRPAEPEIVHSCYRHVLGVEQES